MLDRPLEALLLTNEYPPHVYGGAGVHVEYLARELAKLIRVDVRSFGDQRIQPAGSASDQRSPGMLTGLRVHGYQPSVDLGHTAKWLSPVLGAFSREINAAADPVTADIVHCHTWYTHLGGIIVKLAYGLPLVLTTHSLEPLRPWKREQLQGGYDLSVWVERTAIEMADAVVAVSQGTRNDVLAHFKVDPTRVHVIHNGIDTDEYRPTDATDLIERFPIDLSRPYVLFVGRITRQKGIVHLVRAISHLPRETQVVLCAGAPDTKEIAAEMESAVDAARADHPAVVWIDEMVDKATVRQLYSHAAVFCCPSVYEPFGIINLEAMACETAVVASAVGGIPEVVADGETGLLVRFEPAGDDSFEPRDPERFERDLAAAVQSLLDDPDRATEMGRRGRQRAVDHFSWASIAEQTVTLYHSLIR
jgi:glycogen synthase